MFACNCSPPPLDGSVLKHQLFCTLSANKCWLQHKEALFTHSCTFGSSTCYLSGSLYYDFCLKPRHETLNAGWSNWRRILIHYYVTTMYSALLLLLIIVVITINSSSISFHAFCDVCIYLFFNPRAASNHHLIINHHFNSPNQYNN